MKTICIDQPWASLIVCGIMDVFKALPMLADYRGPVLVMSSSATDVVSELDHVPYEWLETIMNRIYLGDLPELSEMPTDKILGVVDIVDCVSETYSMWDSISLDGKKFRLSNARVFDQPVDKDVEIDLDNLPPYHVCTKHIPSYDNGKMVIPVGPTSFGHYSSGEFMSINLFVDEDVEVCGIFPDLSSYETAPLDRVELVCEEQRAIFNVVSVQAGIPLDDKGDEIYFPSIYEEKRPWESLKIVLGPRKMWVV